MAWAERPVPKPLLAGTLALWLTGDRHNDSSLGLLIKQLVAKHQDGPKTSLFAPSDRIEIGPVDLSPQYSGHFSPSPSSASCFSSFGSSFASSRDSRVRFSRSLNMSTAD